MKANRRIYAIGAAVVLGAGLTLAIAGPSKNYFLKSSGKSKNWSSSTGGESALEGTTSGDAGAGGTSGGDAGGTIPGGTASGDTRSEPSTAATLLKLSWQPNADFVAGYLVYYGSRADDTPALASDLRVGSSDFSAQAPSVTYDPARLGFPAGAQICFRVRAYNDARAVSDWSTAACEVI